MSSSSESNFGLAIVKSEGMSIRYDGKWDLNNLHDVMCILRNKIQERKNEQRAQAEAERRMGMGLDR